ncbi:MAG: hypothetical protein WAQ98_23155 [Blastocatellia bacterium]
MFVETFNNIELRQGDIIEGVFFPVMELEKLNILGNPTKTHFSNSSPSLSAISYIKKKTNFFTIQLKAFYGFSIVLSQCCDLAKRDDGKLEVPAFVLAPLVEVPYPILTNLNKLEALQKNETTSFVNRFYIPKNEILPIDFIVDFAVLVSIPREEIDFVLSRKILEMTDESRLKFKAKLGLHFGRLTQEEKEAQQPKATIEKTTFEPKIEPESTP